MLPNLLLNERVSNGFYQIIDGINARMYTLKPLNFLPDSQGIVHIRLHMSSRVHCASPQWVICSTAMALSQKSRHFNRKSSLNNLFQNGHCQLCACARKEGCACAVTIKAHASGSSAVVCFCNLAKRNFVEENIRRKGKHRKELNGREVRIVHEEKLGW